MLTLSNQVNIQHLPNFEEFKALRNFVHHSIDLFEAMDIGPHEFLVRYVSMFINQLQPALVKIGSELLATNQSRLVANMQRVSKLPVANPDDNDIARLHRSKSFVMPSKF